MSAPHRVRRSLVRSRVRQRILFALLAEPKLYVSDLAREARANERRVRGAVSGDEGTYRRSLSLSRLRLVRVVDDDLGTLVSLTRKGRRVARAWQRESVRAALNLPRSAHV